MKATLKFAATMLAASLTLAGCLSSNSDTSTTAQVPELAAGQKVSIVLESYNYGMAGAWTDTFNSLIGEFENQHPNITVRAQKPQGNSPNPATDTISSIRNQLAAGTVPDVAQLGFSDLDFTIHQLRAKSLDALVGKDAVQKNFDGTTHPYAPTARTLGNWDGQTYGVPFVFSTPVLYLNASLMTRAGLDPNNPPKTWSQVQAAAAQINQRTGAGGVYVDCLTKSAKDWCFQSMVRSNGGRVLAQDRKSLDFASEPAVQVVSMAQNLVRSGASPKLTQQQGYEAFARGQMGMILETSALQGQFVKGAKSGNWDLRSTTMPSFDGKPVVPTNSGASLFILSGDPAKQRASWELIQFLTSNEAYTKISEGIGYLPLRTGLIDDPNGLKAWAAKNTLLEPNLTQLSAMEPWVSMPGNDYLQIRDSMMTAVESAVYQGTDPASTLQAAQKQASSLLPAS
ncbi:ABC transporter substrate-binding protein [Williamsia phyllosphaerae]|uniref:ABC transporter substrate-binding protein n=2 Tax=Williamsia phyllosphaerae TaxID=885042 RepID=A0ABQ1V1I3_9NOCA|nr:ABC transporter substrate-binding protein [Williamsia phyllosphaerae]